MVCEERARQEVRAERLEYIEELEATSKRDKERIHALEAQVARLETEKREHERDVKPAISGQVRIYTCLMFVKWLSIERFGFRLVFGNRPFWQRLR